MSLLDSTEIPTLTESFIATGPEFEELGEQISANIECLQGYGSTLEKYHAKLGTNQDTQDLRAQMKEDIAHGNQAIMKTMHLFQEFDTLNLKKKADQDARNRISRRARLSFELARDRYTRALREVHRKERIYVAVKKANNEFNPSEVEEVKSSDLEGGKDEEVHMYVKDLNAYTSSLPKPRSIPARKIYDQDKGQIKSWEEKAKDLEYVLEDMEKEDEKMRTSGGGKQTGESFIKTKRKTIALVCAGLLVTIMAVFLLLTSSKFEVVSV